MRVVILKLFHFYLFNFSYKFNTVVLHHFTVHTSLVFVSMVGHYPAGSLWQCHWPVDSSTTSNEHV